MERARGRAQLRVYGPLNDHLPPEERQASFERTFFTPSTVKDLIESSGIPHTEVECIAANGETVGFDYVVRDGDRVGVYPAFEFLEMQGVPRLRPPLERPTRFVLDVHLGKLAAYLRMLGFDVFYRNCLTDPQLARVSAEEQRILLTRDRGLLKHGEVIYGCWLRETGSRAQTAEVLRRFDLAGELRPFTRCMACNGCLEMVDKEHARSSIPPRVAERYEEFRRCPECGRVYWKGTHYQRMERWIAELSRQGLG